MNNTNKVKIEWVSRSGRECLKFTFNGILTKESAETAINEWKAYFNFYKGDKAILIWDCSNLTNYEPMARIVWQRAMKEMSDQINIVFLVSQSKLIRTGGSLMSVFTKFKLKSIGSEADIELEGPSFA